jgi:hypothetical protein
MRKLSAVAVMATRFRAVMLACAAAVLPAVVFGQQTEVPRYDIFVGPAWLNSPAIGLNEPGVQFQIGFRPKTWYSLGFDYTWAQGDLTLTPDLLTPELQQQLGATLQQLAAAGLLPPGYKLSIVSGSTTQTFAAGPQLAYRRWQKLTLFARPDLGAIYESATPRPADPIATAIVKQLAPSGTKTDWTVFYGFGGGVDIKVWKGLWLRAQADLVYDHLFSDLLENGRWTVRYSFGPAFNFGRNIAK